MSETRRDALRLSVLGSLGLAACKPQQTTLVIQPVAEYQEPAILIKMNDDNTAKSWVFLQYAGSSYQVYRNVAGLTPVAKLGGLPDLNAASKSSANWTYYDGDNPINVNGATLNVTQSNGTVTADPGDVASFAKNANVAQMAWNEIGKL